MRVRHHYNRVVIYNRPLTSYGRALHSNDRMITMQLELSSNYRHTSVIYTGLDAASSIEILTHLNALAASNRTVVVSIHQPRLEIFRMFHRIVVLSEGKVRHKWIFAVKPHARAFSTSGFAKQVRVHTRI